MTMKDNNRWVSPATIFRKTAASYVTLCVISLSALGIFVIANLVASFLFLSPVDQAKGQREQVIDLFIRRHGIETLRAAYPGMPDAAIRDLLMATGVVGNHYHPYVEFIQEAYVSPEMMIRPEGFRVIGRDQAPWPPPKTGKTVFVFGGSTSLGT